MLNRAARDHVNHLLIGVRSTQYRQNSSQMSSYSHSREVDKHYWKPDLYEVSCTLLYLSVFVSWTSISRIGPQEK